MKKIKALIPPKKLLFVNMLLVAFFMLKCCTNDDADFFTSIANIQNIIAPLPEYVPVSDTNEMTPEKISLGKQLFWDPILSGNKDVACASCHHPDKGYADALDLSIGVGGIGLGEQRIGDILAKRNANTVVNTAFNGITNDNEVNPLNAPMFWDNRALSLEEQALLPLLSKEEMRGTFISEGALFDTIVIRLNVIPEYKLAFQEAFGTDEVSTDRVAKAIASFERTLVANNSPFDQYMRGDAATMSQQQINGMNAFVNVGCAECHSGPMFSDYKLHVLGIPGNPKLPNSDSGTGNYAFRTPTLRNLSFTAPYMHNGKHSSLDEVMNFYEDISGGGDGDDGNGGAINPNVPQNQIDPLARQLQMDDDVTGAIIAFMEALNDPNFDKTIPVSVPSGLPVGGNIEN
ncbi:cytochrome-c peroxidase [Polaribacter atrinae]|uniref:cytochrome-c peroxidase n=1 Tax=Polaribacter atrinae TaxID=1333662 RepID=UPI0030F7DF15